MKSTREWRKRETPKNYSRYKKPKKYLITKGRLKALIILLGISITLNGIQLAESIYTPAESYSYYKVEIVKLKTDNPVEIQIRLIAEEMGFKDADYLVELAYCESRLDPYGINNRNNHPEDSYDRGLFQFNSHWQKRISNSCAFSVDCSTRETIKMLKKGQHSLWMCDRYIR